MEQSQQEVIQAVLGYRPKRERALVDVTADQPESPVISDGALILWMVLALTEAPAGGTFADPAVRYQVELAEKLGRFRPQRASGNEGGHTRRQEIGYCDEELTALGLITRERAMADEGWRDTPFRRQLHPEHGSSVEISTEQAEIIAAIATDLRLTVTRRAQAIRLISAHGDGFAGTLTEWEKELGQTRKTVRRVWSALEATGHATVEGSRGEIWVLRFRGALNPAEEREVKQALPAAIGDESQVSSLVQLGSASESFNVEQGPELSAPAATLLVQQLLESPGSHTVPSDAELSARKVASQPAGEVSAEERSRVARQLWPRSLCHLAVAREIISSRGQVMSERVFIDSMIGPVIAAQKAHPANAVHWALQKMLVMSSGPVHGSNTARRFPGWFESVAAAHVREGGPPEVQNKWVEKARRMEENDGQDEVRINLPGGQDGNHSGPDAHQSNIASQDAEIHRVLPGGITEEQGRVERLLAGAARACGYQRLSEARELLHEALVLAPTVVRLFDGDLARCENQIRLAFQQGSRDFVNVKPDRYALNFYPEWSWPEDKLVAVAGAR